MTILGSRPTRDRPSRPMNRGRGFPKRSKSPRTRKSYNAYKGAVKKRTQRETKVMGATTWTKRNTKTGKFIDQKKTRAKRSSKASGGNDDPASNLVIFYCPARLPYLRPGRFDCIHCNAKVHSWDGIVDYVSWEAITVPSAKDQEGSEAQPSRNPYERT